jgi:dTDP-4-dehydrorhamnose reductase
MSRYDFALALARRFGFPEELIEPVATAELGQAAERPLASGFVLDKIRRDFGVEPAGLAESLDRFQAEWERYGGGL